MKHLAIKKITSTASAVLTAFALSAEAGSLGLSIAPHTHGSNHSVNPIHRLFFPASTYMLDDGTAESVVGLAPRGVIIALNEFAVIPGSETIDSVDIVWGSPLEPDPTIDGLPYTVCLWSDPNGDGSPTDAVLLTTAEGVVTQQGTDTFINTPITPTTITTVNFFIGLLITNGDSQNPCASDEDNLLSNRSYVAGDYMRGGGDITDLNNNDLPVGTIESYGVIGNWLIRANAGNGENNIVLSAEVHRQRTRRVVVLQWSPGDAGTVNILRNGVVVGTTDDDGFAQNSLGRQTGTFSYQVCQTDFSVCSNLAKVIVQPTAE